MHPAPDTAPPGSAPLLEQLGALRREMAEAPAAIAHLPIHPDYRQSADNLMRYLALRRHDIRPLQLQLAALGLSSLGRAEGSIAHALDRVLDLLRRLVEGRPAEGAGDPLDMETANRLLAGHCSALFGAATAGREVRIMVTLPSEAADDYALVRDLLVAGMDCARINSAHDTPVQWQAMIGHLRHAEQETGRRCRILMDLAGPKLRTGRIDPGPAVLHLRPERDALGRILSPARLRLQALDTPPRALPGEAPMLQVEGNWLAHRRPGEVLRLRDARGTRRSLCVVSCDADGCWTETTQSLYLVPGTLLKPAGGKAADGIRLGQVPSRPQAIHLSPGDLLLLTADAEHGHPARHAADGALLAPAQIGCTQPSVLGAVRVGEPIWFDDGRIGGHIEAVQPEGLRVRIDHAPGRVRLRPDKGINLPHSDLRLAALGETDLQVLRFALDHADGVEMSFVSQVSDLQALLQVVERDAPPTFGVVLKIETRRAFESLPALLLTGMRRPAFGIMIARGDLAVEAGFERLAELQEEILCLCEAAHVPVIWATQVLETLARKGAPSRAEITDAAASVRADCVMLNKGPHVRAAVRLLDELLRLMRAHHSKKRDLLRSLQVARQPSLCTTALEDPTACRVEETVAG